MSASAPAPDGVPLPQRYWAILTIGLGLTLAVLNTAIANATSAAMRARAFSVSILAMHLLGDAISPRSAPAA